MNENERNLEVLPSDELEQESSPEARDLSDGNIPIIEDPVVPDLDVLEPSKQTSEVIHTDSIGSDEEGHISNMFELLGKVRGKNEEFNASLAGKLVKYINSQKEEQDKR